MNSQKNERVKIWLLQTVHTVQRRLTVELDSTTRSMELRSITNFRWLQTIWGPDCVSVHASVPLLRLGTRSRTEFPPNKRSKWPSPPQTFSIQMPKTLPHHRVMSDHQICKGNKEQIKGIRQEKHLSYYPAQIRSPTYFLILWPNYTAINLV